MLQTSVLYVNSRNTNCACWGRLKILFLLEIHCVFGESLECSNKCAVT
ncbi:protein of unknown function [Rhodovastum atsumiense]|nr:protein of unknown function [Rhodovastum atsumiense]